MLLNISGHSSISTEIGLRDLYWNNLYVTTDSNQVNLNHEWPYNCNAKTRATVNAKKKTKKMQKSFWIFNRFSKYFLMSFDFFQCYFHLFYIQFYQFTVYSRFYFIQIFCHTYLIFIFKKFQIFFNCFFFKLDCRFLLRYLSCFNLYCVSLFLISLY